MPMFFRWARWAIPQYNAGCGHEIAFEGDIVVSDIVVSPYTRTSGRRIGRRLVTRVTA